MNEKCGATKMTPTAGGDVEVQCEKKLGHGPGDPQHEAWIGVFPVRWRDEPVSG